MSKILYTDRELFQTQQYCFGIEWPYLRLLILINGNTNLDYIYTKLNLYIRIETKEHIKLKKGFLQINERTIMKLFLRTALD
jgi:hypothetical protein